MVHIEQDSLPNDYFNFHHPQNLTLNTNLPANDDFHKSTITPLCASSLLSQMLHTPLQASSATFSPATTAGDLLSDNGTTSSSSAHSTPPLSPIPNAQPSRARKSCISFAAPIPSRIATPPLLEHEVTPVPSKSTIQFAGPRSPNPGCSRLNRYDMGLTADKLTDDATPVPKKSIQFAANPTRSSSSRQPSETHSIDKMSLCDESSFSSYRSSCRERAVKFEAVRFDTEDESSKTRPSAVVSNISPLAHSPTFIPATRPGLATCKSALDAVLKLEATGKVIEEPVEEEDEEENEEEDDDQDQFMLDSDDDIPFSGEMDDGYIEDIESSDDDEDYDDDLFPTMKRPTPREPNGFSTTTNNENDSTSVLINGPSTPVYRTAPPSESDLPDTTDFAPGTLDEDQPACVAFDMALKDRARARRITTPQDIDPTFPDSGSEEESDECTDGDALKKTVAGLGLRTTHKKIHSPAYTKREFDFVRSTKLPGPIRRRSTIVNGRKEALDALREKSQRAVTIKQGVENRRTRRREKERERERRERSKENAAHDPKPESSRGFEKMKQIGIRVTDKSKNIANLACISI